MLADAQGVLVSMLVVSDKFSAVDLATIAKSLVDNLTRLPIHFSSLIMQFDYSLNFILRFIGSGYLLLIT